MKGFDDDYDYDNEGNRRGNSCPTVPMGDPGCMSLYGRDPVAHQLLAEHMTAEYRVKTQGRGRTVDEWKLRAEASDNHWFDGVVGCAVAASIEGASLPGLQEAGQSKKNAIRMSEIKRRRVL